MQNVTTPDWYCQETSNKLVFPSNAIFNTLKDFNLFKIRPFVELSVKKYLRWIYL